MPSSTIADIRAQVRELSDPRVAEHSQRFFKTGPGEYGEGDRFVGVRVPALRRLAQQHRGVSLRVAALLLQSPIHEERLLALFVLVKRYERGNATARKEVFDLYQRNMRFVNSWDLVDSSAHKIIGDFLRNRSRRLLRRLAKSDVLWERRIAIISTMAYINDGEFGDTLEIAKELLHDDEDLIHKAVGWMLREIGNRDRKVEEAFLKKHYKVMPRTMLRYAIEKLPETRRRRFLSGTL
jgi:3-methyladenine DNA glycosylase AlkD